MSQTTGGRKFEIQFTVMSPGLDAWRREMQCGSSQNASMHRCRSRSCSPDQRQGLPEERQNAQAQGQGQGPPESVGKTEEKLTRDRVRAIRSFKFALVEYLKDLLKPQWKEGRLSKDAHKLIVKKSVNKVIESFRDSEIPTDRKIDGYLKASHLKLSKLIQAYVRKYQRG